MAEQACVVSKCVAGGGGQELRTRADEDETRGRHRTRRNFATDVMEQPGGKVHVVDHDGWRVAGEEGCGVELGPRCFAGESERRVTMSRKGGLGKQGFAGGFWTSDYECGWVLTRSIIPTARASLSLKSKAKRSV